MERIQKGFPKEPNPWHLHPIGLIGNFAQKSEEGCGDCAARFKKISKIILNHEGGIVNNKNDKSGLANRRIAWPTWQKYAKEELGIEPTIENLKALTGSQAQVIYFKRFWKPKGFCQFRDDLIAIMVYDWTITSGGALKQIQKMLNSKYGAGVDEDGGRGSDTIKAINAVQEQGRLLRDIAEIRRKYCKRLVDNDSSQVVFLKDWLGHVDDCLRVKS
ncbi:MULTISPECIES: glycosyl hydrolase 108 family protein [Burkholderia]|uniref:glycosyl hydrolase 108 family protein n=1 Tax=Burkholderia TaxID=32008 RepID=UPI001CF307C7|nr:MULTISPECIES: glycosyl hydrolase 108 family protein [Burkholderia]MCA8307421.1 hypothetical protein [Burkholderia sp. AU28942]